MRIRRITLKGQAVFAGFWVDPELNYNEMRKFFGAYYYYLGYDRDGQIVITFGYSEYELI